jgi:Abortive infection C-terminus
MEKSQLEKLFDMSGGYVCNFSDSTFESFFADLHVDIHSNNYTANGTSKAKKLREFWRIEPDHLVGQSIEALIKHMEMYPPFDGFNEEKKKLIGRCRTIASRLVSGKINLDHLKETAIVFDAKHLAEQIRRMELSIESDPALAIGTAKELIETCCKTILGERGKPVTGTPDIPALTKETLKELKLVSDAVPDSIRGSDVIRRLLQNLGTIGNNLAELRGLYGTGHGKHGKIEALTARHARLAVGCASTLATFLFETHKETPLSGDRPVSVVPGRRAETDK